MADWIAGQVEERSGSLVFTGREGKWIEYNTVVAFLSRLRAMSMEASIIGDDGGVIPQRVSVTSSRVTVKVFSVDDPTKPNTHTTADKWQSVNDSEGLLTVYSLTPEGGLSSQTFTEADVSSRSILSAQINGIPVAVTGKLFGLEPLRVQVANAEAFVSLWQHLSSVPPAPAAEGVVDEPSKFVLGATELLVDAGDEEPVKAGYDPILSNEDKIVLRMPAKLDALEFFVAVGKADSALSSLTLNAGATPVDLLSAVRRTGRMVETGIRIGVSRDGNGSRVVKVNHKLVHVSDDDELSVVIEGDGIELIGSGTGDISLPLPGYDFRENVGSSDLVPLQVTTSEESHREQLIFRVFNAVAGVYVFFLRGDGVVGVEDILIQDNLTLTGMIKDLTLRVAKLEGYTLPADAEIYEGVVFYPNADTSPEGFDETTSSVVTQLEKPLS